VKLIINRYGLLGTPTEVIMEHNDEQVMWNIALFDKMNTTDRSGLEEKFDIFEQINAYWAYLPIQKQANIFASYKNIKNIFDMVWDTTELTKQLYVTVADLFSHHELADIKHWIDFHSNLILPNKLEETFKDSHENQGTRERTYLKDDYKWLLSLSVALRIMIPIWGEFIARTKKETGTVFKEYYAFKLLAYTNIARSEPMERLRVYVEHSLPAEKSKSAAILGGISSEDFPTWILALVVVRRLAIGDVRGIIPNSSLITYIYKFIGGKVKGHDSSFIGSVKDKIIDGSGQDSENNLSRLEGYKIKQEIPAGDIAIISFYLKDTDALARKVCPDIDLELVRACVASAQNLETEQIWSPQITLIQWVLKTVIPPRGMLYINKQLSLKAMGVASALLWHKKHYELAGLISAIEYDNKDELMLAGSDSRARIAKDQLEVLDVYYPFSRKPVGKQRVVKRVNPAVESIDLVSTQFSEHEWRFTLPDMFVAKVTGNANNRRLIIPYDIKVKLAALVIALASRSFFTKEEM